MERHLTGFTKDVYDLLIIGGGIYGACVAWDAALRGLSVALVEKADFGSGTSANSMKIIHGGLRYLQQADFKRMRESICERKILMRIAPHLVHPLPVVIPTYGHGMRGKEIYCLALMLNNLISYDRNRLDDPQKHIPRGRVISGRECLQLLPGIRQQSLSGAAIFHDAQVYNSERLVLAVLQSAEKAGADVANYAEVTGFLRGGDSVTGVQAKDLLTGDPFDIRAKMVVNTSGPWVNRVLGLVSGKPPLLGVRFAKAMNLITHQVFQMYGAGISAQNGYRDAEDFSNKGGRSLFITPWRGRSLIGTWYTRCDGGVDQLKVAEKDIHNRLDEINFAYPALSLKREDVAFVHAGLVPLSRSDMATGPVDLAKHPRIHDHRSDGIKGLVSVIGVKYTTARAVAEKVVDRVFEIWGQRPSPSRTAVTPVHGGQVDGFDNFLHAALAEAPPLLQDWHVRRLVYNYGSAYPAVLRYLDYPTNEAPASQQKEMLKAEVRHAVREEMAQKLTDVVFRRTEQGTAGHPDRETLEVCADVMSRDMEWSLERRQQELEEVDEAYRWV